MAVDKESLLAAVAQAGSAGKQAYEQAQQALAAQQADAVRMALSNGISRDANAGAQAELQRIVAQPYQTRAAQLTSNEAASNDWFNRMGVNARQWGDVMSGLTEAVAARAAAQAAGGGGGGGGGSDKPFDWYKNFQDTFGTAALGFDALPGEASAAGATDWHQTGVAPWQGVRNYAMNQYGMPESIANSKWGPSAFQQAADQKLSGVTNAKQARKALAQIRGSSRYYSQTAPGQYNTGYTVNQARQQVRDQYGKKANPSNKQIRRQYQQTKTAAKQK